MKMVRIAIAQINPCLGDLSGNAQQIREAARHAYKMGADIVLTPELVLTGYPPQDLLLQRQFVRQQQQVLDTLRHDLAALKGLHVVVGHVETSAKTDALYNAASVLVEGRIAGTYFKHELPNYGVFDEKRYFTAGDTCLTFNLKGMRFAVAICEDIWSERISFAVRQTGARVLLVLNASPYNIGKQAERFRVAAACARQSGCTVIYANLIGGQDELVFDGASFIVDAQGHLRARLPDFTTCIQVVEVDRTAEIHPVPKEEGGAEVYPGSLEERKEQAGPALSSKRGVNVGLVPSKKESLNIPPVSPEAVHTNRYALSRQEGEHTDLTAPPILAQVWQALVLSVHDYFAKNGFSGAIIGLSGGIDSAVVLAIAVEALGAAHVRAVMMPSRYTADMSQQDACELAQRLGVRYDTIAIHTVVDAFEALLKPYFSGQGPTVAEENIQARVRGTLLMALSNKTGHLVLSTGNKSELSTGYCTLYGDMAGGFAVIKDVPKTLVYALARWCNQQSARIPTRIITRAPSAELRPDQTDQDSLPPYELLDGIMEHYMVNNAAFAEIVAAGFPAEAVSQVIQLHRLNEYKRQQAPLGPRITSRAFGRDWRYPITNGFQETF